MNSLKKLEDHNYNGIDATIIADSKNELTGDRLTTFVVSFPRIVLAEFNTHRMLSRNSASSRAIPFEKMVKRVEENPFIPIAWQKDHKGMQGTEYLDSKQSEGAEYFWLQVRDEAVQKSSFLNSKGNITKQLCNRLLEPFMWHTVIVTATEWENFFALRAHEAAEIHIQSLAFKMLEAYNASKPNLLREEEWHIPFGDKIDRKKVDKLAWIDHKDLNRSPAEWDRAIATARCARVSYMNFDGNDDYLADLKLHDRLAEMGHWSPFEHCAKAMSEEEYFSHIHGKIPLGREQDGEIFNHEQYPHMVTDQSRFGWSGNFRGFLQYRKTFENENRTDERVNLH